MVSQKKKKGKKKEIIIITTYSVLCTSPVLAGHCTVCLFYFIFASLPEVLWSYRSGFVSQFCGGCFEISPERVFNRLFFSRVGGSLLCMGSTASLKWLSALCFVVSHCRSMRSSSTDEDTDSAGVET